MFTASAHPALERTAQARAELARRVALAREACPDDVRSPPWRLLAGELSYVAEPLRRRLHPLHVAPAVRPQTIILIPGFGAHPLRMRYMAEQLERAGHTVKRWGQGFNLGPSQDRFDRLEQRLVDVHARAGEKVVLIGWSLGGVFAREIAKRHPDKVAKVITMGSPFSGNPRANNAWRAYHFVTGHRVEEPPIAARVHEKPPVPTIALWSPRDGIVAPRAACGRPGERDRAVALRCTHMGFAHSGEAIAAVLRELDIA